MTCYICARPNLPFASEPLQNADVRSCRCDGCGTFEIEGKLIAAMAARFTHEDRLRLSGAIRRASDERRLLRLTLTNCVAVAAGEHVPDAIEQADSFIGFVARTSRFGTSTPPERCEAWTTRLYLPDWSALSELQRQLGDFVVLLQQPEGPVSAPTGPVSFRLTLEGWARARELRSSRAGNQAFVAMWFHDGMKSAYLDGIKPALEEAGFAPFRIDFAHHNRRIDDEIMAQIRQSRLLVADATGGRASVYYEAGFADGPGVPVIWCCSNKHQAYTVEPSQLAPVRCGTVNGRDVQTGE
jgi:hypothetical protein